MNRFSSPDSSTEEEQQHIFGKNSVLAAVKGHPERVIKIWVAEGLKPDKRLDQIYQVAKDRRIPIQCVPKQKLNTLLEKTLPDKPSPLPSVSSHQGVIALVAPTPPLDIHALLSKVKPLIQSGSHPRLLMLDGVTDPQNVGAILRTANAAGLQGVIMAKHHGGGFGPSVTKAASGAETAVDKVVVGNLVMALSMLKENGFWVIGAASDPAAKPYTCQDYAMPTVLVLGSEGHGLSRLVREACDFLISIPLHPDSVVDSLNVSAATAILVFHMVNCQKE